MCLKSLKWGGRLEENGGKSKLTVDTVTAVENRSQTIAKRRGMTCQVVKKIMS